jgi:hypothetical protein
VGILTKPRCLYGASTKVSRGKILSWGLMALRRAYSGVSQNSTQPVVRKAFDHPGQKQHEFSLAFRAKKFSCEHNHRACAKDFYVFLTEPLFDGNKLPIRSGARLFSKKERRSFLCVRI